MHFVRRHVGGGRRLERPPIEFLAARTRPHARVGARRRALDLQLGDLPLERRRHLLRGNRPRAFGPAARDAGRPPRDRVDERATLARALRRHLHLGQGLVDQKHRRHQAGAAGRLHPGQLPVQLHGVRLQPRQIRLRVRGVLDRMVAVEESWDVEIRADVLDHDVGRVAPTADRDVAIRKSETLGRDRVCAPNHFDARARGVRERRGVDRPDAAQVVAHLAGNPLLSLRRPIGQLRAKRRAIAGIDAERGRAFRRQAKQVLGNPIDERERFEPRGRLRILLAMRRHCRRTSAARRRPRQARRSLRGGSSPQDTTRSCTALAKRGGILPFHARHRVGRRRPRLRPRSSRRPGRPAFALRSADRRVASHAGRPIRHGTSLPAPGA